MASAVTSIEVYATRRFRNRQTGAVTSFRNPHVRICYSDGVRDEICELTQRMIGEPLQIWMSCRVVSAPIVREALCSKPCFDVSSYDLGDAWRLAHNLKVEPKLPCP